MGARDVIKHIKDALASAHLGAVDEVTEYVADMASEPLADGGREGVVARWPTSWWTRLGRCWRSSWETTRSVPI